MKAPKDMQTSLAPWTDPVWCARTPEAENKRLAQVRARRVMAKHGVEDARVEAALVEMAAWVEEQAAAERAAAHEDGEAWGSAVPVEHEADKRRSRLALLGTVVFVLGILCGVVLAVSRLR
ncbi:hypothetical protein SOCEGT47_011660 [Sorangium cellulosum]|uniref:Uncharacterized protein n=1 Tax=Sorangium cellulosum TaxID=56 RepID=A0A4P2PW40_SORCE|nr:hypothetical protein [Sorangium cellulosum]AUX20693.1 hypothetical protein SOCEGT47_011660 [Sorangium cellulosum]